MRPPPDGATADRARRSRTSRRRRPRCPSRRDVRGPCAGRAGWSRELSVPGRERGAPSDGAPVGRITVPPVLHPVGPLPAGVYWRRRLVVLLVLLALLAGAGWLGWTLWTGRAAGSEAAGTTTGSTRTEIPRLEQVVPSLAGLR